MLLPQNVQHLRCAVRPMVTTVVARAVSQAARRLFGAHGGIVGLLPTESMWVEGFDDFAEIVRGTLPGISSEREARAAATVWGLYVPGNGAYLNGAFICGKLRASMDEAIRAPDIAAHAARILAHETVGHGYIAENTHFGRTQAAEQRWRQALAFGARSISLSSELAAADDTLRQQMRSMLLVGEGWAEWVTETLRPYLAQHMPGSDAALQSERRPTAPAALALRDMRLAQREAEAAELLGEALAETGTTWREVGMELWRHLADTRGLAATVAVLREVCGTRDGARPDVRLLALALEA